MKEASSSLTAAYINRCSIYYQPNFRFERWSPWSSCFSEEMRYPTEAHVGFPAEISKSRERPKTWPQPTEDHFVVWTSSWMHLKLACIETQSKDRNSSRCQKHNIHVLIKSLNRCSEIWCCCTEKHPPNNVKLKNEKFDAITNQEKLF